jgi:hypothetical protein
MCTQYLHYIHPPTFFLHLLPWLTVTNSPSLLPQTWPVMPSCSLILWKKEKKWHFCLFKIVTQGVSLWYFHVYMDYNLNCFISSIFLLSTFVPFLKWFQKV